MSIQQTKKQSDLEKRLRLLRTQVYGKSDTLDTKLTIQGSGKEATSLSIKSDISYLYQDLLKIGVLSALALGTQVVLFSFNLF